MELLIGIWIGAFLGTSITAFLQVSRSTDDE